MGALDSNLTVGILRTGSNAVLPLQGLTDPDSVAPYTPANGPKFIPSINQVCERLANEGLWKGVTMEVWYPGSPQGYITLPRRALTAQGVSVLGRGREVFTQMNQFKFMGMGWRPANKYSMPAWTDLQDGWCTNVDIDPNTPAYLQLQISNSADAGKTVWIDGNDVNGNRIFDASGGPFTGTEGFTIAATFPAAATTSFQLTSVNAINAQAMLYPWSLWQVVPGSAPSLLSLYEPGEQIPKYRRYKTGIIGNYSGGPVIVVYARIRPLPLFAETDPVLPGCYSAIKFGLQALIQEDAMNRNSADKLWADGMVELNNQIKAARGRVELSFPMKPAFPRNLPQWVR